MTNFSTSEQTDDLKKESNNDLVFSYLTLRNLIGICGMLLPLALILTTTKGDGDRVIEPSISDYYYTTNGDVFVVLLSVLGVFFFTYKGYRFKERLLTITAAVCVIGVAFSPTASTSGNSMSIHKLHEAVPIWFGVERHFVFAATFFLAIALISLIYFPKTNKDTLRSFAGNKTAKAKRNDVFIISGWTIIGALILIFLYFVVKPKTNIPVVFILETIAVEAFGLSWITKGQTLWPDGQHYLVTAADKMKAALKNK